VKALGNVSANTSAHGLTEDWLACNGARRCGDALDSDNFCISELTLNTRLSVDQSMSNTPLFRAQMVHNSSMRILLSNVVGVVLVAQ